MAKFRGKVVKRIRKFPDEYHDYGFVYGWYHGHYNGDFSSMITHVDEEDMETKTYDVQSHTVGQSTELFDCKGKEIFEGDILKFDNGLRDVEFFKIWKENGGLVINQFKDDFKRPKEHIHFWSACADQQTQVFIKQLEIIGNVYDNKDLLV